MKKILLVGSNGFIGTYLFKKLSKVFSISSISKHNGKIKNNFTALDLTNNKLVNNFTTECDVFHSIIFLVGLAHSKGERKDYIKHRKINFHSLRNLLLSLDEKNKLPEKIIFSSTIAIYGEKYCQKFYDEESNKTPLSPYAISKLEAEKFLSEKFNNISWILRFAPVYSNNFTLNIRRRTKIKRLFYKVGNGNKRLSLCNIENIGEVIQAIMDDKVSSGVYNISDIKEYTYYELLKNQNANPILPIPKFLIFFAYLIGESTGNYFLIENAIKLATDNIFPSNKIRQQINFSHKLQDNYATSTD